MPQIIDIQAQRRVPSHYASAAGYNVTRAHCLSTANDVAWLVAIVELAAYVVLIYCTLRLLWRYCSSSSSSRVFVWRSAWGKAQQQQQRRKLH